jgi:hypothetical protein
MRRAATAMRLRRLMVRLDGKLFTLTVCEQCVSEIGPSGRKRPMSLGKCQLPCEAGGGEFEQVVLDIDSDRD